MRWKLAAAPVLAMLAGCAPMTIKYDYDRNAGFAALKTYAWYAPKAGAQEPGQQKEAAAAMMANPIMERRVHRIVEAELAVRGFRPAEEGGAADFLLNCYPVYRDRVVRTYTSMGPGWGWGYRPWGYGFGTGFEEVQRYREGSLVLEMADPRTNQMIWQAVAEGALTGIRTPESAEERVTRAVKRMLGQFPPAPGKP